MHDHPAGKLRPHTLTGWLRSLRFRARLVVVALWPRNSLRRRPRNGSRCGVPVDSIGYTR